MTEQVVEGTEGASSEELTTSTEEVVDTTTTQPDPDATWKARLAGKDSALTRTIQERDAAQARLRELENEKAERERSSLTEVERLRLELEDRDRRIAVAEEIAKAATLRAKFPLAFEATDGALLNETALAKLETTLMAQAQPPSAPVLPTSPPKRPGEPPAPKTSDELKAELRAMPNPFGTF